MEILTVGGEIASNVAFAGAGFVLSQVLSGNNLTDSNVMKIKHYSSGPEKFQLNRLKEIRNDMDTIMQEK